MPEAAKPFLVTNVKPRLICIAGVNIPPTETREIPAKHAEAVRKSAVFRSGMLVEGETKVPLQPLDIAKMGPAEAVKIVQTETDIAILNAWADEEKRPSVLTAIQERVKAL